MTREFPFPYPAHYLQQSKRFIILFLSLLFNTAHDISNFKEKESSWRNRDFILGLPIHRAICAEEQAVTLPELLHVIKDGINNLQAVYPSAKLQYISVPDSILALKRKCSLVVIDRSDKYIMPTAFKSSNTGVSRAGDADCASFSAKSHL